MKETYVYKKFDLVFLEITADLGCQQDTSSSTEFTVLLVQFALKNKFFKVDKSHGNCRFLKATFILGQFSYLSFQAAQSLKKRRIEE